MIQVVLLEDEKLSADYLVKLITNIDPSIQVVKVLESVEEGVEYFAAQPENIQLIFADIHLSDGLSFDIFHQFQLDIPVIFTTAFDDFAIKAFKLNSIDYLLKPLSIQDVKSALDKFKRVRPQQQVEKIAALKQQFQINQSQKERFLVKSGDLIQTINTHEISFFVYDEGIVFIYTHSGKRYMVDYTIEQLENLVSSKQFFRINRKVLVNIECIVKVNSYFNQRLKVNVLNLNEEASIVSREKVADFKRWLNGEH